MGKHTNELTEIKERLLQLERDSHPPIGLCEFDGFKEIIERIEKLEELIKKGEPKSPLPYTGAD